MMYNVRDIAKMTGTHTETVKRWIRNGELKAIGGGKGTPYQIWPADYEEFAKSRGYWPGNSYYDALREELLLELDEISKLEAMLYERRGTILNTLERLR